MRIILKDNSEYKFSKIVSIMEMNEVIIVIGKAIPNKQYRVLVIHKEMITNFTDIFEQLKKPKKLKNITFKF